MGNIDERGIVQSVVHLRAKRDVEFLTGTDVEAGLLLLDLFGREVYASLSVDGQRRIGLRRTFVTSETTTSMIT